MTLIERLISNKVPEGMWNASYNTMHADADECHLQIVFYGAWPFEPMIGADEMLEARGTARVFARQHPETERYEIWRGERRVEACDLVPPSTDDRVLQALGWPNASEAAE